MKFAALYGTIAGVVIIALMMIVNHFVGSHDSSSLWLGYLVMLLALSVIFVGVKRYRDIEGGGVVSFGRAFAVGLGIGLFASVAYVIAWEAYQAMTGNSFMTDYVASANAALDARDLAPAELARERAELATLQTQYADPLFRLPMTFLEIFPVALIVALASAGILRNPRVLPLRRSA